MTVLGLMFVSKLDGTSAVRLFSNMNLNSIFRKKRLYQLGPLNKAKSTIIKIVFIAHIIHLVKLLDTIKVEMVDGRTITSSIFVNNGKGGRRDDIVDTQLGTQRLDKGGFTGSHLSVEGKYAIAAHSGNKLFGGFVDGV